MMSTVLGKGYAINEIYLNYIYLSCWITLVFRADYLRMDNLSGCSRLENTDSPLLSVINYL